MIASLTGTTTPFERSRGRGIAVRRAADR